MDSTTAISARFSIVLASIFRGLGHSHPDARGDNAVYDVPLIKTLCMVRDDGLIQENTLNRKGKSDRPTAAMER